MHLLTSAQQASIVY